MVGGGGLAGKVVDKPHVDPARPAVTAYRSRSDIRILLPGDVLEAEDVIEGFSTPVESLFEE
ncbi:MAG: hypothetical protein AMXMBFR53_38910 [Gemmatimonadota bacterium]